MSSSSFEDELIQTPGEETLSQYLKRKENKFRRNLRPVKEEEEEDERSESPVRKEHPPPEKKKSGTHDNYVPPSPRDAGIPKGFKRSTCELGHPCKNALCYAHTTIPGCVWDRKKYPKPYIPPHNNIKKFDVYSAVQHVEDIERERKARRQVKTLKKQK